MDARKESPVSTATVTPAGQLSIPESRITGGRLRDDFRGMNVVWRRELIRFARNRVRIITALVQPVLFLFVLGTGLSPVLKGGPHGFDFKTFLFPGILGMTVLFTAMFSAISIVWDREFGFMREMLVAPVRRSALVVGKCAGGATVATLQGAIIIVLAGLVGVPYSPILILTLLGEMALTAFGVTALGVLIAARMSQVESFQFVMQLLVLPMFFLSGAVFPLADLPQWLAVLTRLDPLSYAIAPMRTAVFEHIQVAPSLLKTLEPAITWDGWRVPLGLELGLIAAAGVGLLFAAVAQFSRPE
jgi:ABC-2 type transport system permease protein